MNGAETVLTTVPLTIPGGTYAPGSVLHLRLQATGSAPTTLFGKAWFGAATEPTGWQVQATDSAAALQGTGAIGLHVYGSSSATNTPITLTTDNLRATTPGTEPPPPVNVPPTAAFTATPTDLAVAFNASGSGDPDGSIATYAWTFGDGATATTASPTTAHTYAAGGTYTVSLTVTDDDGGTGSTSQPVTVVAEEPPPTGFVAQDLFGRTVAGGWGAANIGGSWTTTGTASNFSVSGGTGRIVLPSGGSTRTATLGSVAVANVDALVDLALDKAPTGGGVSLALLRAEGRHLGLPPARPTCGPPRSCSCCGW